MAHRDGTDYDPIRCPVCGQPDFCRADCPELAAEMARDLARDEDPPSPVPVANLPEADWLRTLNEEG